MVIIDGSAFGRRPDAVIHLPGSSPLRLHGNWISGLGYRDLWRSCPTRRGVSGVGQLVKGRSKICDANPAEFEGKASHRPVVYGVAEGEDAAVARHQSQ